MRYRSMLLPATKTLPALNILSAFKRLPVAGLFLFLLYGVAAPAQPDNASISAIVDTTTQASNRPHVIELEQSIQAALRKAIQGEAPQLTRAQLEQARETPQMADIDWLNNSGYDFAVKANQQAGIALLESFSHLSTDVLQQNTAIVTRINREATTGQREQALVDAEGQGYLYYLADALGPRLGKVFINAYNHGEIRKAAVLLKLSAVSTSAAKQHFNYPRPFLQPNNTIHLVPDTAVIGDNKPYTASGGAFPSGHTNTGYTDALLLAEMIPERFVPLIDRGARYGYSRIVLGVHYPLDVIGSRMLAERNVAHYLNDPQYRRLFEQAKTELRSALEKACGTTLSACAKSAPQDDPYAAPEMKTFYRYTMTYGLPAQPGKASPISVPEGAEVLLDPVLPHLSAAERKNLMVKTALADGYPLSGALGDKGTQNFWQRLNLHDAVQSAQRR
ncbi:phosphoesterase PA-phosphatase related [Pectobacterium carotovorum subsp. carotovorum PC1]|uniref:Phosphoesterase PA-phosphatase related n=2 Tax=Pectobacteriaceae TaxID=1903410 RepID=C6DIZ1_PECCP|nr:phosphatase PAP2 family protein [Pectobacterium carotovorum]ACT13261.1 phosphoesterase PA-phosphatase related [Pectobacterium carotovorum subsp. carotovorum PC1]